MHHLQKKSSEAIHQPLLNNKTRDILSHIRNSSSINWKGQNYITTAVGRHWLVVMEFHHAHALYPAFCFAFLLDKGSCQRLFPPNWCTRNLMLLVTIWSESGCPQRFWSLQLLQNQESFISFMQHVYTNEKEKRVLTEMLSMYVLLLI